MEEWLVGAEEDYVAMLSKITKKLNLKNKPKSNPQLNRAQNFHDSRSKSQGNMTPEMMHSAYNQTGSFGGA